jgi:hypothetical protein
MIRTYTELSKLYTFEERYAYLLLQGDVGSATFGFDRYLNQMFYASRDWKHIRQFVIARDHGCDLAVPGYEIHNRIMVHHMNPLTTDALVHTDESILDPDNLITTTFLTHNAIHFGDSSFRPKALVERKRGDTRLW